MKIPPNFKLINTFLTLAETRSYTETAVRLGISQPSVTSNILKIEEIIGVKLFHRTKRQVSISASGERLYAQFSRLMNDAQKIMREAA